MKAPHPRELRRGGGRSSGLPTHGGIGQRKGRFDMDPQYLKNAQMELNKLNEIADFDDGPKPI